MCFQRDLKEKYFGVMFTGKNSIRTLSIVGCYGQCKLLSTNMIIFLLCFHIVLVKLRLQNCKKSLRCERFDQKTYAGKYRGQNHI